jgi:RNA polymerase sigma-70 factor, ECF subfamily
VGGLTATLPGVDPVMDPESRAWVAALAGEGGDREAALERLHALLLRAARFELGRRRGQLAGLSAAERLDLATQAADDAMMGVLARLGDFRGLSRFTTWAYKFALLRRAGPLRRAGAGRRGPRRPPARAPGPPGRLPGLPGGAREPPGPGGRRHRLTTGAGW